MKAKMKKPVKAKNVAVKKAVKVLHKKKIVAPKKNVAKKIIQPEVLLKTVHAVKPVKKALANTANVFSPKDLFKAKIKVVGIGGGGGSIVSEIGRSLHKATFVIADTDMRAFQRKKSGIKYFAFGQKMTHGLGTGLDTDLAGQVAELEKEKITSLFEGQDIVIFIASLGGGLGSGATRVFAEASSSFGGISLGIFTTPFKFEGNNKHRIAQKALKELRPMLNVSITIPNEKIFKIIDENTAITEAFSLVNKSLIESLESLIDLIYNPGIINIDFADLKAILSGKGNLAFLNTAEASGKDRAEKITHEILNNPLYQTNNFTAEKVLFNISGGGNLSMFEVDKISRSIAEQNPKAKIIFGISKNAKHKNKIKTTLLMTGPSTSTGNETSAEDVKEPKKTTKPVKTKKILKKKKEEIQIPDSLLDVMPSQSERSFIANESSVHKIGISAQNQKKSIRRNALEIKKAEELTREEQSDQEKEWEIPTFLRKIKFKP